jgi:transposase-like protein
MRYSHGFKNSVLVKLLPPMNQGVAAVASDTGVTEQTIRNWLSQYNDDKMTIETDASATAFNRRPLCENYTGHLK